MTECGLGIDELPDHVERAESGTRGDRAAVRLAIAAWLLFGFAVWNVIFDYEIRVASDVYLARAGLHEAGRGPRVTIDGIVGPAKVRGVRRASLWGGAVAAAGIALTQAAARRGRKS